MKIGNTVKTDKGIGHIKWIDNPWLHEDGSKADILVKVIIEKVDHWFRMSELHPIEIEMEKKIVAKIEKIENMKELIEFSEFIEIEKKLEIKIGKVINVEDVVKSNKLIKLTVDFGSESRTVVTNIKPLLTNPQSLISMTFPFITNLKPVKMMGIESTAMIMPGDIENGNMVTVNGTPGTKLL